MTPADPGPVPVEPVVLLVLPGATVVLWHVLDEDRAERRVVEGDHGAGAGLGAELGDGPGVADVE
ncbi:hypothetical protein Acsp02_18420 [Actinoplanes sp. NBRC 103695]|nr:hypothetical protein Acsp02_18420 [Actinoplanes sp. NBRC 103695]